MCRGSTILMVALVLAGWGCTVSPGPSPYRHNGKTFPRVDDYEEPAGLFTITPARPNTLVCPACGAVNTLGASRCSTCNRRISVRPLWKTCDTCGGKGKTLNGRCPECEGRGYVKSDEK